MFLHKQQVIQKVQEKLENSFKKTKTEIQHIKIHEMR